jgi:putative AdoMet-dependent methyltransferase
MNPTNRTFLFDQWAKDYDPDLESSASRFPFDGYDHVLDEVVRLAGAKAYMRVLDLGIGTGNLAARFVRQECAVWGVDFSTKMLAQAHKKLPQVNLVQANLLNDWPAELPRSFDRVVSTYVLHEFDLQTKIGLLKRIAEHLTPEGAIVIGDIAFPTVVAREEASRRWADGWDEDEYYWAADETIAACEQAGLKATYRQISSYGGVFTFEPKAAS